MSNKKLTQTKRFFDFEKELDYISEMNRLGWKLERIKFGRTYCFAKTEPREYTTIIYAEKESKVKETAKLAEKQGYKLIPHTSDGLKNVLYLTGKTSEVSPVFRNNGDSLLRAQRMMFKRFFVMSVICVIILAAMITELSLLFIVPLISSGKSPFENPLFFALTIGFSVLTLIFLIFSCVYIRSTLRVKNNIEKLLTKKEEKTEKRRKNPERKIDPALFEQTLGNEPEKRAADKTKEKK